MPVTILVNATIIDGLGHDPAPGTVVLEDGRIADLLGPAAPLPGGDRIDLRGMTLLPGLIDAHVHMGAVDVYFGEQARRYQASHIALKMAARLRHMLDRGYTTIRDVGGMDAGFRRAIEEGLIPGPRIQLADRILSQTGGHGDMRTAAERWETPDLRAEYGMTFAIADGDAEVRRAVRDQVRRGADLIKVMAGGGAASPTDKLESPQYSMGELRAIVEEATMAGIPVAMHALAAVAIRRAVEAGARSIEHGNFLDDETAAQMAAAGTYLVPTVATYVMASRDLGSYDYSPEIAGKVTAAAEAALRSLEVARRHGVRMGSGSDLLGHEIAWLNRELELKAEVLGPMEVLRSATSVNAELLGRPDLGAIEPGRCADLVAIAGDPLADIAILGDPARIRLVMKGGVVHHAAV